MDFKANDGKANSNIARITIIIAPTDNHPPVAQNQTVSTNQDVPTTIVLQGSDADNTVFNPNGTIYSSDNSPLFYSIVTAPSHGTATIVAANNMLYTPNPLYNGTDNFTFKVNDGLLDSNIATVTINVGAVNQPPVAQPAIVTIQQGDPLDITLTGTDSEGATLSYSVVTVPSHGTLTGTGANLTYKSESDFEGYDSVVFKVNDGSLDSDPAIITINVTRRNHAPVAYDYSIAVVSDTPEGVTLPAKDPDADDLSFVIVTQPQNGTLSGTFGELTYTPAPGYVGSDFLTFYATDGLLQSNTATVTFSVAQSSDYDADYDPDLPVQINLHGQPAQANSGAQSNGRMLAQDSWDPSYDYTQYTLFWDASSGLSQVAGYEIWRADYDKNGNENWGSTPVADVNATETSWTDTNLVANKVYLYRVMAWSPKPKGGRIHSASSSLIPNQIPFIKGISAKTSDKMVNNPGFKEYVPSDLAKWYLIETKTSWFSASYSNGSYTSTQTINPLTDPSTYSGSSYLHHTEPDPNDPDGDDAQANQKADGSWSGNYSWYTDDDASGSNPIYYAPWSGDFSQLTNSNATTQTYSSSNSDSSSNGSKMLSREYPRDTFVGDVIKLLPDFGDFGDYYDFGSQLAKRYLPNDASYCSLIKSQYKFRTYPSNSYKFTWLEVFQPDDHTQKATFTPQTWTATSGTESREFLQPADPSTFVQGKNGVYFTVVPEVRDINTNTSIITDGIAWIDATPKMPQLVAQITGLPSDFKVKWRLNCLNKPHTKNGGKQDATYIPGPGASNNTVAMNGNEPWYIYDIYAPSNSTGYFFGGDVEVYYTIINQDGSEETPRKITFQIGGLNPDDPIAKSYIQGQPGNFTYAWAIAKEESKGGAQTQSFYNQFNERSNMDVQSGHGRVGAGFYCSGEANGWGMFQRDDTGDSAHPVTR